MSLHLEHYSLGKVSLRTAERKLAGKPAAASKTKQPDYLTKKISSVNTTRDQSLPESSESLAPLGPTVFRGLFLHTLHRMTGLTIQGIATVWFK